MDYVRLSTGRSELVLAPATGGGVARLSLGGRTVLRPASDADVASGDPLRLAEFPMAPWVNRIAGGRMDWAGETIDVSGAPVNEALGLHGFAWRVPWRVDQADPASATLSLDWCGGDVWPFACRMERTFCLSDEDLHASMSIRNLGTREMPVSIGWHPCFPARQARLQAVVRDAWETDARLIPVGRGLASVAARLREGADVADLSLDHCFNDWDGVARLTYPGHTVEVRAPGCRYLQVYAPHGQEFLCVEPQTAMPDAFGRPDSGLRRIAPGETVREEIEIAIGRHAWPVT
jgi:aldose 1-epimerase